MNRIEFRDYLNRFKPYIRDSGYGAESILDIIADGLLHLVQTEFVIRSDVTIKTTSDYNIFRPITSNREIDKKHVRKLIESITKKNLLYIRPVLVNENMDVIDGQHRIEACVIMQIPVCYMVCPGLVKEDIHFLNSVQKNWTTMDFINYFTIENRKGYHEFSRVVNEFSKVKVSIMVKLCSTSRNVRIRDGFIDIGKLDEAKMICAHLYKLGGYWKKKREWDFVYSAAFAMALQKCVRTKNFQFERLCEQIEQHPDLFLKYTSRNEYLKSLHIVYNKDKGDVLALAPENSFI